MNDKQHEALHKISVQYERANGHEIMSYCPLDNRIGNALVNMGFARRSYSKYRGKYSYQLTDKGAQKIGFRDLADMLDEDNQPAHPRPTDEDEPRSPAGGGNPEAETLDAGYDVWADSIVNPGWTADELIASLRRENMKLLDIIGRLQDSIGAAEREIVFLRHRPAALR